MDLDKNKKGHFKTHGMFKFCYKLLYQYRFYTISRLVRFFTNKSTDLSFYTTYYVLAPYIIIYVAFA